jgi:hypothetical protein
MCTSRLHQVTAQYTCLIVNSHDQRHWYFNSTFAFTLFSYFFNTILLGLHIYQKQAFIFLQCNTKAAVGVLFHARCHSSAYFFGRFHKTRMKKKDPAAAAATTTTAALYSLLYITVCDMMLWRRVKKQSVCRVCVDPL